MTLYDFGSKFAETHTEKCECGERIELSAQKYRSPVDYTVVYVRCQSCGQSVAFVLPVD